MRGLKALNSTQIKLPHPTKGSLEIGRWSKQELGNVIINMDNYIKELKDVMKDYELRYGFHTG